LRAARETIGKIQKDEEGKRGTGVPRFVKEFPHGPRIADAIIEWLGVKAAHAMDSHFAALEALFDEPRPSRRRSTRASARSRTPARRTTRRR
jgi:hypothetical protein